MDNFLDTDIDNFIHNKSIYIFEKLNDIKINPEEVQIVKKPLSGISNTIYRVQIHFKNSERNNELKVKDVFFKVFGRISVLVDRELETYIMETLGALGLGPIIYETDLKTYRIEQFKEGYSVLKREEMLIESILQKVIKNFATLNTIGEYEYLIDLISNSTKDVYYEKVKNNKLTNIINFTVSKMRPHAIKAFEKYVENFNNDIERDDVEINQKTKKLDRMKYILENLDKLVYEACPDQGIILLSHNDAHPLNILHKAENAKVILCDFEYSSYNFIGFDIANYIIERQFYLEAPEFPFYQFTQIDVAEFRNDENYQVYLKYFSLFEDESLEYSKVFKNKLKDYDKIIETCKSRDYYNKMLALSSLLWFVFAVIYLDYESIKTKRGYNYYQFALDRLSPYEDLLKNDLIK